MSMTYTLTTQELLDMRADLDIPAAMVFDDTELQRLYNRAGGVYEGAVALAWRQIWASSVKMHDYKAAQSSESLGQVSAKVKEMMDYWMAEWDAAAGGGGYDIETGVIGSNIDATEDNRTEWDGTT